MIIAPVKTHRIDVGESLLEILDRYLPPLQDGTVVAITSKIVALCERSVRPMNEPLGEIVKQQAQWYLSADKDSFDRSFTVTGNTLLMRAGIDRSQHRNLYILWPNNPQATANQIRRHLSKRHGLKNVGVIITDSTSTPLRRGVTGIAIAHSGFSALNKYRTSQANIAGGLAAAAVLTMGEGTERTPIATLSDLPLVKFRDEDPAKEELEELYVLMDDDLFAPFLQSARWLKGDHS